MKFEIKHRFSGAVLFSLETKSLRLCVQAAVEQKANLDGANLGGANLDGANLGGANLGGANLGGANLREANLREADLRGAYLGGANLREANLREAYLGGAYLGGANLREANLREADLRGAYLGRANLRGANLGGANFDIPSATPEQAIKNLDTVAEIILENEGCLYMDHWHGDSAWEKRTCAEEAVCGTTHCLAGWLQVCSTDEKIRKLDPYIAGSLLAPVAAKMFYASNSTVIDWLKNREYAKETA